MLSRITLKRYGAVTNGLRHQIKLDKTGLLKYAQITKNTFVHHHYRKGRSKLHGSITAWHRGGGHKKRLRKINLANEPKEALTIGTTYDPNRSALISILFDLKTKKFFNTLSTSKLYPGALHETNIKLEHNTTGNRTMLKKLPIGTLINNISIGTKSNGKYVRAAGTYAQVVQVDDKKTKIKLPSNKIITLPSHSYATIGTLANELHNKQVIGKAGIKRALGRRPITRGIAMNPVDHPHGGRTNGGKPSVTPWGLPTKCKFSLKTRKKTRKKNYE